MASITSMESTANITIDDLLEPQDKLSTLSDWAGDKAKYFLEGLSNISFYISKIPTLYGLGTSPSWNSAESGFKNCKKLLAFPNAIRGSMVLYEKLQAGGTLVRNIAADVCYVIADTIDGVVGFASLGAVAMNPVLSSVLARIKDITGIFGLSNTSYNLSMDLAKLRRIDLNKVTHSEIKDAKKAAEYKKNWVKSEIDNRWYDILRNVSSIGLCILGTGSAIAGALCAGVAVSPWIFAAIVSVSVYGKFNMYAQKTEATFWQTRYAELLPKQKAVKA